MKIVFIGVTSLALTLSACSQFAKLPTITVLPQLGGDENVNPTSSPFQSRPGDVEIIEVVSLEDNKETVGTLRWAIEKMKERTRASIVFNKTRFPHGGTIELREGPLNLSKGIELKILGFQLPNGLPAIKISGNEKSNVFRVDEGTDAYLKDIEINNGRSYWGAGIQNSGRLKITNVVLFNNKARTGGGAIMVTGSGYLEIENSKFLSNIVEKGNGGAILSNGTLKFLGSNNILLPNKKSLFEDNEVIVGDGPAIYNNGVILNNKITQYANFENNQAGYVIVEVEDDSFNTDSN